MPTSLMRPMAHLKRLCESRKLPALISLAFFLLFALNLMWPLKEQTPLPLINEAFNSVRVLSAPAQSPELTARSLSHFTLGFQKPERLRELETIGINIELPDGDARSLAYRWFTSSGRECFKLAPTQPDIHKFKPVWFTVDKSCAIADLKTTTLEVASTAALVFRVSGSPSLTTYNPLVLTRDTADGQMYMAGYFSLVPKVASYAPRLLWILKMWRWNSPQTAPWATLLLFFLAAATAASLIPVVTLLTQKPSHWFKPALQTALAAFLLSATYATIIPPLQGPDEADHFRSFSRATLRPELDSDGLALANQTHFDRLMCHMIERLNKRCLNEPMDLNWWPAHAGSLDPVVRSPWAAWVWHGFGTLLPSGLGANWVHWGLRVFNAFYGACLIGLCVALRLRASRYQPTLPLSDFRPALLTLFLIPTLWHFANHNSNYTFILGDYFVLVLYAWPLLSGASLAWLEWLLLAVSTFVVTLSGKSAILAVVPMAGVLGIRMFCLNFLNKNIRPFLRDVFFSTLIVMIPAFTILAFQNQPYVTEELQRVLQRISLSTILLMTLVFPFVFLVLGGVGRLVDNLNRAVAAKIANVTPWLGKFVLACYLLFLFVPLIFKTQPIGNIETITPKPDSLKYAIEVVSKFVLNSSLLRDDFLLIRSFWGGFGCPETVFPRLPVQLLQNVVWLGWFLGLYSMIKERTLQPVLAYLALAALVLIWLTLVAFGVQTVTVHGRYLVGFYMLFISGGIVGFWKAFQSPPLFSLVASRLTPVAFPLFLALILGLHAATFTALFFRYFGV